jgi:hypothetical protein
MDIFNAPTREHATVARERTNTPLQALVTMNDTQFVEAARTLAQKTMREAGRLRGAAASPAGAQRAKDGDGFDSRLDYVTSRLLARELDERERAVAKGSYDAFLDSYRANPEDARTLLAVGDSEADEALPAVESAAWTMLVSELMNLDEVLNK